MQNSRRHELRGSGIRHRHDLCVPRFDAGGVVKFIEQLERFLLGNHDDMGLHMIEPVGRSGGTFGDGSANCGKHDEHRFEEIHGDDLDGSHSV